MRNLYAHIWDMMNKMMRNKPRKNQGKTKSIDHFTVVLRDFLSFSHAASEAVE